MRRLIYEADLTRIYRFRLAFNSGRSCEIGIWPVPTKPTGSLHDGRQG
jgi:hypothetical protein